MALLESCETANIASTLVEMGRRQPHSLAVLCPHGRDRSGRVAHTHLTYRQLDRDSETIAKGLREYGIGHGTRTVLMVRPSLDFFALTFALFRLGAVPVMVDPGMGVKNLGQCLQEAQPQAFIGIPKAQLARRVLGWGKATIQQIVTVGGGKHWGGVTLDQIRDWGSRSTGSGEVADTTPSETAAILFTSGSTGVPKGVVYTHSIFLRQVHLLRTIYGIEPGEIDLCTFPLFALYAPGLGMTAVVPDMDPTRPANVDPAKIFGAIEDFGVTNLFGSPALINRVGRYGEGNGLRLPTLRRVISAGAPVPAAVLQRFQSMLNDDVQIFTPYGATESLPVCNIGSHEILSETRQLTDQGKGVCVGRPVEGVRVEIIPITDEPIPQWSDDLALEADKMGEIAVRGPNVTREYYRRPHSNELAKIPDPATDGFFHRMGDVGYRDSQGRIWFCGRKSHRVQCGETTLFTIPSEGVFNTHPAVFRSALVPVTTADGVQPVLCVELEQEAANADKQRLVSELCTLGERFVHTAAIRTFLFHPGFPVDIRHNAKIFREKLAVWAAKQLQRKQA